MKIKAVFLALVVLLTLASCGKGEEPPKVLLFIRTGSYDLEFMLAEEVGVMTELLEQSGFQVVVATLSGNPIEKDSTNLRPDLGLDDVIVADYAGFILPCMSVNYAYHPEAAVAMVKTAAAEGKPVAAQHSSILTLAKAGLLVDKKFAFATSPPYTEDHFLSLKDGIHSGTGVVQDGNMITSGLCPYEARDAGKQGGGGTEELTRALIAAMEAKRD